MVLEQGGVNLLSANCLSACLCPEPRSLSLQRPASDASKYSDRTGPEEHTSTQGPGPRGTKDDGENDAQTPRQSTSAWGLPRPRTGTQATTGTPVTQDTRRTTEERGNQRTHCHGTRNQRRSDGTATERTKNKQKQKQSTFARVSPGHREPREQPLPHAYPGRRGGYSPPGQAAQGPLHAGSGGRKVYKSARDTCPT